MRWGGGISCTAFEFTAELSLFDLLGINLYHGWVFDRQDVRTTAVLEHLSYNQAVEKVVAMQSRTSPCVCCLP